MKNDPLVFLPMERWQDLEEEFLNDWPRGLSGYCILKTVKEWEGSGYGYGFKVYCPYGDVKNGMAAINVKDSRYEVFIQCPQDDTSKLEEALLNSKVVDWTSSQVFVPVAPAHVFEMLKRLAEHYGKKVTTVCTDSFILDKEKPQFEVKLPPGTEFKLLSPKDAELVESKWPYRYSGSLCYVILMIKAKSAYGLFLNDQLVSWMLVTEAGAFNNLYTLEHHRGKGYAEMVVKLVSNALKRDNKHVFGFVTKGNVNSFNLFTKLGFTKEDYVDWCFLDTRND